MKKASGLFRVRKMFSFWLLEIPLRLVIVLFLGVACFMIAIGCIIGILGLINYGITGDLTHFLMGAGVGIGGGFLLSVLGGFNDRIKSYFF